MFKAFFQGFKIALASLVIWIIAYILMASLVLGIGPTFGFDLPQSQNSIFSFTETRGTWFLVSTIFFLLVHLSISLSAAHPDDFEEDDLMDPDDDIYKNGWVTDNDLLQKQAWDDMDDSDATLRQEWEKLRADILEFNKKVQKLDDEMKETLPEAEKIAEKNWEEFKQSQGTKPVDNDAEIDQADIDRLNAAAAKLSMLDKTEMESNFDQLSDNDKPYSRW